MHLVIRPREKMAEVMRKHLLLRNVRLPAKRLHRTPDIEPVKRSPCSCDEHGAAFYIVLFGVLLQHFAQLAGKEDIAHLHHGIKRPPPRADGSPRLFAGIKKNHIIYILWSLKWYQSKIDYRYYITYGKLCQYLAQKLYFCMILRPMMKNAFIGLLFVAFLRIFFTKAKAVFNALAYFSLQTYHRMYIPW